MAGSLNKVQLIGRLGADPEIKQMVNGKSVARLSIATSQSWKDKSSGERKEKTEWHRVVIFNEGLVNVVQQYVKKGANVYIEGQLSTRKWKDESTGQDKYSTEIAALLIGLTVLSHLIPFMIYLPIFSFYFLKSDTIIYKKISAFLFFL